MQLLSVEYENNKLHLVIEIDMKFKRYAWHVWHINNIIKDFLKKKSNFFNPHRINCNSLQIRSIKNIQAEPFKQGIWGHITAC